MDIGKKKAGKAFKEWIQSLKDNPQRRIRLITAVGLAGILMISLSECSGNDKNTINEDKITQTQGVSVSAQELEKRLEDMIEHIEGVGEAIVMITFEDNGEKVYVSEEKMREETVRQEAGEKSEKVQQKNESEESYIMVDSENGGKTALVSHETAPKIKGVVVVCDGGDSPETVAKLNKTVKTALNIGSNRICVLKRGK